MSKKRKYRYTNHAVHLLLTIAIGALVIKVGLSRHPDIDWVGLIMYPLAWLYFGLLNVQHNHAMDRALNGQQTMLNSINMRNEQNQKQK